MYKIAFCSLNNTNFKRLVFYKKIYDYLASNSTDFIIREELIDLGLISDLSMKKTLDEIKGLLYAPFLIADCNPEYYHSLTMAG